MYIKKKRTAVEFYIREIFDILGDDIINILNIEKINQINNLSDKAKEIEKEQIIGSYLQGRMEGHNLPMSMDYVNLLDGAEGEALKHYKETYED